MKATSIAVFLLGLVLCPGYLVYTTMFSGEELVELTLLDRDIKSTSIGGFTSTTSGGNSAKKQQSIHLSPDMNPIRLIAKADYVKTPNIHVTQYSEFELYFSGSQAQLWKEKFTISESEPSEDDKKKTTINVGGHSSTNKSLKIIDIEKADTYSMKLQQLPEQEVKVSKLSIEIRKNVQLVKPAIYITGIAMLALGLIGIIVGSKKS